MYGSQYLMSNHDCVHYAAFISALLYYDIGRVKNHRPSEAFHIPVEHETILHYIKFIR
ncbi:MAG: hypothetical protein J07HQW2_02738 [Haloquadratum walsbyi J07HQW2]|uniref:Uncharacterized protein n=1 Tax=Haloquadratum walsbyi J07HQW2 TaxID=1238425 RepID=U1NHB0_9EURY|nr:MAG: hypothetical protein J07HQW2_02738 [Haloquadratum walsbyi J07HQW2]